MNIYEEIDSLISTGKIKDGEDLVYRNIQGGGVVGVVDGYSPLGIENEVDIDKRKSLLRRIGYKK